MVLILVAPQLLVVFKVGISVLQGWGPSAYLHLTWSYHPKEKNNQQRVNMSRLGKILFV